MMALDKVGHMDSNFPLFLRCVCYLFRHCVYINQVFAQAGVIHYSAILQGLFQDFAQEGASSKLQGGGGQPPI